MSRISYFQRFSQRENHATNNTLLLLRYFSEEAPAKLQSALQGWLHPRVEIGLSFEQQVRKASSVPDGCIRQSSLEVYFEVKHGSGIWLDQIKRHVEGIKPKSELQTVFLIGLTKEALIEREEEPLMEAARERSVTYRGLTFSKILADLREICASHDETLHGMLDDYQGYLESENLLDSRSKRMAIVPCGKSYPENLRFGLYYEDFSRSKRRSAGYIGIYYNKAVIALGRISSMAIFTFKGGVISKTVPEEGIVTEEQVTRLKSCFADSTFYKPNNVDLRVFFVEKFETTEFRKTTPNGIWALRYLDFDHIFGAERFKPDLTTKEIADLLKGHTFQ